MLSFIAVTRGYARPMTTMWSRARWLLRAGPADYMLAMSVASASLPVIGEHLEPLGAATAMGIWGYRHMPDFLGATARSWFEPGKSLVLVHESNPQLPAQAFILNLPEDWQYAASETDR